MQRSVMQQKNDVTYYDIIQCNIIEYSIMEINSM